MKLYMKEKVFSWKDKFTIVDEREKPRYTVEGEFFSFGKKLHVYDTEGTEVAFLQEKVMSWMPRYIVQINGEEAFQIAQKFALLAQKFDLEGLPWHVDGNFWGHDYTLYDDKREVMRLAKHWFTWGDSYELEIQNPEEALFCVCVVLAIDAAMSEVVHTSGGSGA